MAQLATMDFFGQQEHAHRRTRLLVFYFITAVIITIIGVYAVIAFALKSNGMTLELFIPELFLSVSLFVLAVVALGSLYKTMALSKGGSVVAGMMGARHVQHGSSDPDERKLLNVVEEMAIASGMPIPKTYILEEDAINAFAAGFSQDDAIVCVTRGSIRNLTRDELQGVVAHEFSHILNGDMRLNIRIMGIIHGLLILGILGYYVMRGSFSGRSNTRRSSSEKGNGQGIVILIGIAFLVFGYIGVFFGNLIKAAVSRNREFLADASAVQFTRNPAGIAGALKKIGGFARGSRIENPKAMEASHFFFETAVSKSFLSALDTHPPLPERVKRIDPSFNGKFPAFQPGAPLAPEKATLTPDTRASQKNPKVATGTILPSIGHPSQMQLAFAAALLASLPSELEAALQSIEGAEALLYSLLLDDRPEVQSKQLDILGRSGRTDTMVWMNRMASLRASNEKQNRIALADLALSSLKAIDKPTYASIISNVDEMIHVDMQVSIWEMALRGMIQRQLSGKFSPLAKPRYTHHSLTHIKEHYQVLFSTMAWTGTKERTEAEHALQAGMGSLSPQFRIPLLEPQDCTIERLGKALDQLGHCSPHITKTLLESCVAIVGKDDTVTADEFELIRAVADSLRCPIPPLVVGPTALAADALSKG